MFQLIANNWQARGQSQDVGGEKNEHDGSQFLKAEEWENLRTQCKCSHSHMT